MTGRIRKVKTLYLYTCTCDDNNTWEISVEERARGEESHYLAHIEREAHCSPKDDPIPDEEAETESRAIELVAASIDLLRRHI